jgi:hypothetical protein
MAKRKTSRSRRKSSSRNVVTREHAFGSLIIILAGFVAVGGLALNSNIETKNHNGDIRGNSVGQAIGGLRTVSTSQSLTSEMTCFNNCMSSCSTANSLTQCIDLTTGTCKGICNIETTDSPNLVGEAATIGNLRT